MPAIFFRMRRPDPLHAQRGSFKACHDEGHHQPQVDENVGRRREVRPVGGSECEAG